MKRKVFKWMLGISIAVLIFITVYLVVFWSLANAGMALVSAMMSYSEEAGNYEFVSFFDFYKSFVGSPMFYVSIVAVISLITSIVMLIITRKNKKS